MMKELWVGVIGSGIFSFLVFGWGLFSKEAEDKALARKYFWNCFFASLAVWIYFSYFWKPNPLCLGCILGR